MNVTFYGAVREVTGSMHLVTTENDRILMDCGLFQGRRKQSAEKNANLPFDPQIITNVILSHAHIDHSGRIPMLTKGGFSGRIICTRATAAACGYLLPDSAHIQESDSDYLNYKTLRTVLSQIKPSKRQKMGIDINTRQIKKLFKKNRHNLDADIIDKLIDKLRLEKVQPLYTRTEAAEALENFDGYPYRHPIAIGKSATCTMYDAGHILGSAMSLLKINKNGKSYTLLHTGDIGRFNNPILHDPCLHFREEDRGEVTIHGERARWIIYSFYDPEIGDMMVLEYILVKGKRAYIISGDSPIASFYHFNEIFIRSARSFRFE